MSRERMLRLWRDWRSTLLLVLVLLTFRSALADWYDVPTGSMQPTILEGERIFVNKLAYGLRVPFTQTRVTTWSIPERGDVVTFPSPRDGIRLIKRVVGLPGDVLVIHEGILSLNGKIQPQSDAPAPPAYPLPPQDRWQHEYLLEDLAGIRHAVMLTPGHGVARDFGPVTVPEGMCFVMGDNRDNSADSRFIGFVPMESLEGRAQGVVLSIDHDRHWKPRWGRFFRALD